MPIEKQLWRQLIVYLIKVPIANLRREPKPLFEHNFSHQKNRETQLLLGEKISPIKEVGEWIYCKALEQNYHGWIHRSEMCNAINYEPSHVVISPSHFSYGTYLQISHNKAYLPDGTICSIDRGSTRPIGPKPEALSEEAERFIGMPYLWGGRASFCPKTIASVDCSGLINLLFRAQGLSIPRDAHDQYEASHPVDRLELGTALFLSKSEKMTHVMLYVGEDRFIEAPETGKSVRYVHMNQEIHCQDDLYHIAEREGVYRGHLSFFTNRCT